LALFFLVGGLMNLFATELVRSNYVSWGYPSWFHYVTAIMELSAAFLLVRKSTCIVGSVLGGFIMFAAAITVFRSGDTSHAMLPLIVLSLIVANAWFILRES
jgi:hypothetical protein